MVSLWYIFWILIVFCYSFVFGEFAHAFLFFLLYFYYNNNNSQYHDNLIYRQLKDNNINKDILYLKLINNLLQFHTKYPKSTPLPLLLPISSNQHLIQFLSNSHTLILHILKIRIFRFRINIMLQIIELTLTLL